MSGLDLHRKWPKYSDNVVSESRSRLHTAAWNPNWSWTSVTNLELTVVSMLSSFMFSRSSASSVSRSSSLLVASSAGVGSTAVAVKAVAAGDAAGGNAADDG